MKSDLIRHLNGENIGRFPVWMMRQAGRYLPNYQAVRKQHSFWEMATTPKLISDVSLLPLEVIDVDAIIFFADILTLPHGLGLPVQMKEAIGPYLEEPMRTRAEFDVFQKFDAKAHVPFLGEALNDIRKKLDPKKALIGFAGAPWTVACYLVEGKSSKNFDHILPWMHKDPEDLAAALRELGKATSKYLRYQVENHVEMVQLFDTWISWMPKWFFEGYYLPILQEIFHDANAAGAFTTYFPKHSQHVSPLLGKTGAKGFSVDTLWSLTEYEKTIGKDFHYQGNLEPTLLLTDEGTIRRKTRELVNEARKLSKPAILNLGHGILPPTPVANAKAFIDEARALWV